MKFTITLHPVSLLVGAASLGGLIWLASAHRAQNGGLASLSQERNDAVSQLRAELDRVQKLLETEQRQNATAKDTIKSLLAEQEYATPLPQEWHEGSVLRIDDDTGEVTWSTRRGLVATDDAHSYSFHEGQKVLLKVTGTKLWALKRTMWPVPGLEYEIDTRIEDESKRFWVK